MLYCMNWLTYESWRVGVWLLRWCWHILSHWWQVEEQAPKPVGWMMCLLLRWPLFLSRSSALIFIYIYLYVCILYMSSVIGCIYIQQECRSVLVELHPITFYTWHSILMCNKSTSAGTSLDGTPMFAHVTLCCTFNLLGSKCPWWQDEEAAS